MSIVPHFMDHAFSLYVGDVREVMAELEPGCVQTVVTSPPYWGLRDYGTAGQLGLEKTPELYVEAMVEVFAAVRRVLRDDGTVWLNIGDSYFGPAGGYNPKYEREDASAGPKSFGATKEAPVRENQRQKRAAPKKHPVIKTKELVGLPWMVAFALRADGWYLRSDIIWAKKNPMPEAVTDRPTKSHEHVFLLTKQPKYYYDAEAIKEPASYFGPNGRNGSVDESPHAGQMLGRAGKKKRPPAEGFTRNKRDVWTISGEKFTGAHFAVFPQKLIEPCILAGCPEGGVVLDPFMGSGTTAIAARSHGRRSLGIELSPDYADLCVERYTTGKLVLR